MVKLHSSVKSWVLGHHQCDNWNCASPESCKGLWSQWKYCSWGKRRKKL